MTEGPSRLEQAKTSTVIVAILVGILIAVTSTLRFLTGNGMTSH